DKAHEPQYLGNVVGRIGKRTSDHGLIVHALSPRDEYWSQPTTRQHRDGVQCTSAPRQPRTSRRPIIVVRPLGWPPQMTKCACRPGDAIFDWQRAQNEAWRCRKGVPLRPSLDLCPTFELARGLDTLANRGLRHEAEADPVGRTVHLTDRHET